MGDEGDRRDDPDRAAILARRQQFVAIALSGLTTSVACTTTESDKPDKDKVEQPRDEGDPANADVGDPPETPPEVPPQPCLSVIPEPPPAADTGTDDTETGDTDGGDTDDGKADNGKADDGNDTSTKPPPRPCLKKRPPKPKPCLKKPPPTDPLE